MNADLTNLVKTVGQLVIERRLKLATAESCTGGLIAAALTHWPGSSAWFECGVIAYTNAAKKQLLAVPDKMLITHGAVSEVVAAAMCAGLKQNMGLSVTGIAGPDSGSAEKPVGTVCFGWQWKNQIRTATQHFVGNREQIRHATAIHALSVMAAWLQENDD